MWTKAYQRGCHLNRICDQLFLKIHAYDVNKQTELQKQLFPSKRKLPAKPLPFATT